MGFLNFDIITVISDEHGIFRDTMSTPEIEKFAVAIFSHVGINYISKFCVFIPVWYQFQFWRSCRYSFTKQYCFWVLRLQRGACSSSPGWEEPCECECECGGNWSEDVRIVRLFRPAFLPPAHISRHNLSNTETMCHNVTESLGHTHTHKQLGSVEIFWSLYI